MRAVLAAILLCWLAVNAVAQPATTTPSQPPSAPSQGSQGPSPTPRELPRPDQKERQPNRQATTPDKHATDELPLTVKVLPSEPSKHQATKEEYEAYEKPRLDRGLTAYTGWLAVFTAALFFAAFGQVMLFWWQLRLIREGAKDAKMAAEAAKASADAAVAQAKITEQALFSAEIPYLWPVIKRHRIDVDGDCIRDIGVGDSGVGDSIVFAFGNHGRTPAILRQVHRKMFISVGVPPPIPPDIPGVSPWDIEVIPAGSESHERPYSINEDLILAQTVQRGINSEDIIWFSGCALYGDVFGNEYAVGFCFAFGTDEAEFYAVGGDTYNYWRKIKSAGETKTTKTTMPDHAETSPA